MTNKEIVLKISEIHPNVSVSPRFHNQIVAVTERTHVLGLLITMKSLGFEHLSNITCVDWIKKARFDVTYNLWSYQHKAHAVVKAQLKRDNPEMPTLMNVWLQAQVYEREVHEMFGVHFDGNPDLSPLFLHNWKDIPPLRKDFDTEEYARKAYGVEGGE